MNAQRQHRTMAQRWERLQSVPGLRRDMIALAVLLVLSFGAAGYLLSQVNVTFPWADRYELRAELQNAVAVQPANQQEVRIAGVKVGLIKANEPTDHNTSIITMEIEPGHTIYDNARLIYRPVNPLNQMYATLNPGAPPGRPLPSGGLIPLTQTASPVQTDDVLDKLDEKSRAALTSLLAESDNALAQAPATLPVGLRAADSSLATLRPVVTRLEKRHDNIEKLVAGLSRLSAALGRNDARLTSMFDATQHTLQTLAGRNDELGRTLRELPGTTDELRRALTSTSNLTRELNPTLDSVKAASKDLPDALDELQDALGPLRDTADAAEDVVHKGRPFVENLKDSVRPLHASFRDLAPVTACLDEYTEKVAPWMYDLGAFVFSLSSQVNVRDVNGTTVQANVTADATNPLGAQRKHNGVASKDTNRYQDAPSATTGLPYPAKGSGECR